MRLVRDLLLTVCFLTLIGLIAMKLERDDAERLGGAFRVVDGDSLDLDGRKLRLRAIDAPELAQTCFRDGLAWPCGAEAREALKRLMTRKGVVCSGDRTDKYRRLLVECAASGEDLNAAMVRSGMAVSFGGYQPEESEARQAQRGIWAGEFERPSDWRKGHRHAMADEKEHGGSFLARLFDLP
ncbi:thermonuclease family protein [Rhizobium sp. FKL33]|uniref:thermonuclease family protein n=1 Tax=Rhizobium sp. FKL33 TaxID=2562307 RepID=UPI001484F544|nr:thermonuclease family protein [Rhizobium sp. FKL33]